MLRMDLTELVRNYLFLFFIIGQTAFNPRKYITKERHRLRYRATITIPVCCTTIIVTTSILCGLYIPYNSSGSNSSVFLFSNSFIFVMCITNYSILIKNTRWQNNLRRTLSKFMVIEQIFLINLRHRIDFVRLARRYRFKCLLSLLLYAFTLVALIVINMSYNRGNSAAWYIWMLNLFTNLATYHIIFHIDVVYHFTVKLIEHVDCSGRQRRMRSALDKHIRDDSGTICMQLDYYKYLHFKLWEATQELSAHFGLVIMFICLQNFMDMSYSMYWIYRSVRETDDIRMISKYFFIYLDFCR